MYFAVLMVSYLRLTQASPMRWLGSIKKLLGLPGLEFSTRPRLRHFAGVSTLQITPIADSIA